MRKRTSIIWTTPKEVLQNIINDCKSLCQVLEKLGYSPKSAGSFIYLKKRIEEDNIDISLLEMKRDNYKKYQIQNLSSKSPIEKILTKNSKSARSTVKRRLIQDGVLEYKCSKCGISEWNGEKLSLQLDHINGINDDNRKENLRLLCPNCHSQTKTFCGKGRRVKRIYNYCNKCGSAIAKRSKLCRKCNAEGSKIDATKEELEELIQSMPYTKIGEIYGVTDNAIKKRAKNLGINLPKRRGYWAKMKAKNK